MSRCWATRLFLLRGNEVHFFVVAVKKNPILHHRLLLAHSHPNSGACSCAFALCTGPLTTRAHAMVIYGLTDLVTRSVSIALFSQSPISYEVRTVDDVLYIQKCQNELGQKVIKKFEVSCFLRAF